MSDDLLERALDGMLSDEEERDLARRLTSEPALARRYLELSRDEALLAEFAVESRALAREEPPRPVTKPRSGARWALPAAAALLLVGLFIVLLGPPPARVSATMVELAGRVEVLRDGRLEAARPGEELLAGEGLRTGPSSTVRLRGSDGTLFLLHEETSLYREKGDSARPFRLLSGTISVQVAGSVRLSTPHAEARGQASRFDLSVTPSSTRLEAEEGETLLFRDGAPFAVPVGHFAVAQAGRDLLAQPLQGAGLRAEYFDQPNLTGLKVTRVDPQVDFLWENGSPDPLVEPGTCSARWSGRILPRSSGLHTFTVQSDDGARLWVDGRLVLDHWQEQTRLERSGSVALEAWRFADLRLEWLNLTGPGAVRLSWQSDSRPKEVIPASALFPAPPGGRGLKGEHFDGDDFTSLKVVRLDPSIDFHWGLGSPHPTIRPDGFSSRWTGFVEPAHSETYAFHTVSDDGVRLWVDGRLLIDDWKVRGTAERSGTIDLRAGERVEITLEHFDRVSTSRVSLLWSSPSQPKDVIPRSRLYPAP